MLSEYAYRGSSRTQRGRRCPVGQEGVGGGGSSATTTTTITTITAITITTITTMIIIIGIANARRRRAGALPQTGNIT